MPKRNTVTLLDVTFTRTAAPRADGVTHLLYKMKKVTPFGELSASLAVEYATFLAEGAAQVDGHMYNQLSAKLNEEESRRMIEGSANLNFGVSATEVA